MAILTWMSHNLYSSESHQLHSWSADIDFHNHVFCREDSKGVLVDEIYLLLPSRRAIDGISNEVFDCEHKLKNKFLCTQIMELKHKLQLQMSYTNL